MLLFTTLAAWGAVSGVFALYAAYRFAKAMISLCDPLTATAVRPTGAYAGLAVWVTGASSGLGLDLSRLLAADGAKLVLSARRKDVLEEVKAELVAAGASPAHIVVLPLDLASLDSLPAAATQAVAAFGGLDVLINNGGISQREVGSKTSFAVDVELTAVDYLSCVALAKAVLPSLASSSAAAGGRIINISSVAGKIGAPLRTAYAGAKAALLAFFDALRVEEHALRTGVRITNVCPGSTKTNIAVNAATGNGSKRGQSDANIESGLPSVWVCDRILAAAHCGVDEVWIAPRRELFVTYAAQYCPALKTRLLKKAASQIIAHTLADVVKRD